MVRKSNKIIAFFIALIFMFGTSITASADSGYKDWTQSDSRWGNKSLGSCGDTMAEIGCAVTSIAILVVHSGSKSESSFNPGTLCDYLSKNGGFDNYGNVYWGAVSGLVPDFTFEKKAYFSSNTKSGITNELKNYINQGYYIVMSVKYDGHWVAIDTISNGEVYMIDPAQNKTDKLFDYYDAAGMLQVRLYKGKNLPAKVDSTTVNPSVNYLTGHYKTTDALNLRKSYSTSSDILLTIPNGTTVVVTRVYNNQWGQVEYKNNSGWIYLEYTTYTESSYSYKTGNYKVNVSTGVYMRTGIGGENSTVCLVPYNGVVNISSVSANWGKATYNNKSGWICMEYLDYVGAATTQSTTTPKVTANTTVQTTVKTTTTTKPITTTVTTTTNLLNKGDVNLDGKIDKTDLICLNRYLAKPYETDFPTKYNMDVNNDKVIDERDAVYLFKKINKGN
ncbi:MAG: SH3 domain-containing protein [Oscillospiraceae bacterium]|nr:SH3 domain-containing protein [Oscillospiraceae bacterium]